MIRCTNIPSLSFLESGGMLYELNELSRWTTVDQILSAVHEYTGNGRISGWLVTSNSGLNVNVSEGVGITSGIVGITEEVTPLLLADDTTNYIYAHFDGSEKFNIGEADPEYDSANVEITHGSSWENYCARIATVVTLDGEVSSIIMEDTISILSDLVGDGLDIIDAHVHDGEVSALVDLSSHITGTLDSSHLGNVDAGLVSGLVVASAFAKMSHKGLWYAELDVAKYPAYTQDYYTYTATTTGYGDGDLSWAIGVVPKVWRNGTVVDLSEYTYNQDDRTVTFYEQQNISSEIEIASRYTTYTASISISDRDDVSFLVYKNRKLITTGYTTSDDGDITTFTFDEDQAYSDSFMVCAEGYYIPDIADNYGHQEIDDYVSNRIAYGGLEDTEATAEVILQSLLSDRHIKSNDYLAGRYSNHEGGLVLFTPYVDSYDTTYSTVPEPTSDKVFDIPAGSINDLYPEWSSGDHYRTKEESGDLVLDIEGAGVVLVIDKSGSMAQNDPLDLRLDACKEIVADILDESPDSQFYVIGFSDRVYDYSDEWQTDVAEINSQIDECVSIQQTTDYILALEYAQPKLDLLPSNYVKMIILITDGIQSTIYDDNDAKIDSIIANGIAGEYNNSIYTVGVGDVSLDHLMSLSRGTGGVFYYCSSIESIDALSQYLLYGDGNSNGLLIQSGYWEYEYDFGDTRLVVSLSSTDTCPAGCSVILGYSYSVDGVNWSEYTYDSTVGLSARYWKFVILLSRNKDSEPIVSQFVVSYVEPTPYYLWLENSVCTEIPHNVQLSPIVEATACRLTLGLWNSGDKNWDNCQSVVVLDQDLNPDILRRGVALTEYATEYAFVIKIENMSKDIMHLHDFAILYNSRGNW